MCGGLNCVQSSSKSLPTDTPLRLQASSKRCFMISARGPEQIILEPKSALFNLFCRTERIAFIIRAARSG